MLLMWRKCKEEESNISSLSEVDSMMMELHTLYKHVLRWGEVYYLTLFLFFP